MRDKIIEFVNSYGIAQDIDSSDIADMILYYEKNKWISVKYRLPENNERCIVYNSAVVFYANYKNNKFQDILFEYNGITHWMPLPEPPEEAER